MGSVALQIRSENNWFSEKKSHSESLGYNLGLMTIISYVAKKKLC